MATYKGECFCGAVHIEVTGEPQVMGISRASAAHQAWLRCNKLEMRFVTIPARFADRELAFLDFGVSGVGLNV